MPTTITSSPDLALVRLLEECCFNAWPTLKTVHFDGWVIRLADGHTRRANSASALFPSTLPPEELVARVETLFRAHGLMPAFRLTPLAAPELDAMLHQRGWRSHDPSVVLRAARIEGASQHASIRIAPVADAAWIEGSMRAYGYGSAGVRALTRMLPNLALPAAFLTVEENGCDVGWALGVAERGHVGLYDLVVHAPARGRGIGRRMVAALLAYGQQQGASAAYLQTRISNEVAQALYASFGFREVYRYTNRVLET